MPGQRAQHVLSQIEANTYEREDINERRLGLIADAVEITCEQLGIDSVVSNKRYKDVPYKTLDYNRPTSLLTPAVSALAKRVGYLDSKLA